MLLIFLCQKRPLPLGKGVHIRLLYLLFPISTFYIPNTLGLFYFKLFMLAKTTREIYSLALVLLPLVFEGEMRKKSRSDIIQCIGTTDCNCPIKFTMHVYILICRRITT